MVNMYTASGVLFHVFLECGDSRTRIIQKDVLVDGKQLQTLTHTPRATHPHTVSQVPLRGHPTPLLADAAQRRQPTAARQRSKATPPLPINAATPPAAARQRSDVTLPLPANM